MYDKMIRFLLPPGFEVLKCPRRFRALSTNFCIKVEKKDRPAYLGWLVSLDILVILCRMDLYSVFFSGVFVARPKTPLALSSFPVLVT